MKAISVDPSVMHGTACFAGTRVPIEYVFSYLPNRVGEFLGNYPTVTRQQVVELLREIADALAANEAGAGAENRP
jgi:uncharacterized protein (DUF433 family)